MRAHGNENQELVPIFAEFHISLAYWPHCAQLSAMIGEGGRGCGGGVVASIHAAEI